MKTVKIEVMQLAKTRDEDEILVGCVVEEGNKRILKKVRYYSYNISDSDVIADILRRGKEIIADISGMEHGKDGKDHRHEYNIEWVFLTHLPGDIESKFMEAIGS